MNKEELIIGKNYRVKSKEWFDANKDEENQVVVDGEIFNQWELCGKSFKFNDFHNNLLEISVRGSDRFWKSYYVPLFALEEDPGDTRTVSKEVQEAIDKLKIERFIYGYDGGPGGGSGGTIDFDKQHVTAAFDYNGVEGVCLNVSHCKRFFSLARIAELFKDGKTETSFKASEWTTIRTELKLIEDKTKLPEYSSWSTMRD